MLGVGSGRTQQKFHIRLYIGLRFYLTNGFCWHTSILDYTPESTIEQKTLITTNEQLPQCAHGFRTGGSEGFCPTVRLTRWMTSTNEHCPETSYCDVTLAKELLKKIIVDIQSARLSSQNFVRNLLQCGLFLRENLQATNYKQELSLRYLSTQYHVTGNFLLDILTRGITDFHSLTTHSSQQRNQISNYSPYASFSLKATTAKWLLELVAM